MRHFFGIGGAASPLVALTAYLSLVTTAAAQTPPPSTTTPSEPAPPPSAAPSEAPTLGPAQPGFPTPTPSEPVSPAASQPTAPASALEPAPPAATAAAPAAEPKKDDPNAAKVSFKPGKGVDIKSADGNFSLNTRLKSQLLYEAHFPQGEENPVREHFVPRRIRLAFQGNVFSPNIKYKLEVTFAAQELNRSQPSTVSMGPRVDRDLVGQVPLLDAYFDFTYLRDLNVRIGQSKVPFGRERVLSDNDLITVDRSFEDIEFNLDRDMGIDIRSTDLGGINLLHYYLGVYLAEERNSTLTSLGTGDVGLLYNARVEVVPLGNFEETPIDFDHGAPKLSIGVAYNFLQTDANSPYARQSLGATLGALNDVAKVDYNVHNFTADLLFKGGGLSVLAAFHYRKAASLPATAGAPRDGFGVVGQASYLFATSVPFDLAVSYGLIRRSDKEKSSLLESNELTAGFNFYPFNQQGLKIAAEYARVWYQDTSPLKDDNRLRVQLQVLL